MKKLLFLLIIFMLMINVASAVENITAPSASVNLYGEKTDVVLGEDILLKLSAVNLITKPKMHVQVIIIPPSGMSVTSSEFVQSGAGQFTTTYELEPGKGRDIEVRIRANQVGDFNVNGRIIYYFGTDQSTAEDRTLSLPIKVRTPTPTPAASETTVSISNTTTTPNSNITRSITVENVNNLAAATIWLTYDPNVVNVLSVSAGDFGGVTPNIDNTIGKTTMSAFSTTPKSGSIAFANVQLKAAGSLNTTSPLTLTVSSLNDQNGAAIPYTIKNGTFTISSVIKGDVSGDGTVTIVDALFVAQYTVGLRTLSSQQLAAADVNNDGQVTIVDALFIAQYTVGLRQL